VVAVEAAAADALFHPPSNDDQNTSGAAEPIAGYAGAGRLAKTIEPTAYQWQQKSAPGGGKRNQGGTDANRKT
jgi:hypothetical protein